MLTKDLLTTADSYKTTLGEANDEVLIPAGKVTYAEILPDDTIKEYTEPTLVLSKWHKEETLSIIYENQQFSDKTLVDGEVRMSNGSEGFYFKQHDTDTLKFGLILNEQPKSNVFTFKLSNWENYEFNYNYNPDLDFELHPEKLISETDELWLHAKGGIYKKYWKGWNVYHKTKRDCIEGQTNYKVGRFCNILPPILLDANGKQIGVAELLIKDGLYILTVDRKILDNAKYPVKFNDTFGYSDSAWDGTDFNNATYFVATRATSNPAAGTVSSITGYFGPVTGSGHAKMAIYTQSGSAPATLVANSESAGVLISGTGPFTANTGAASVSNQQYWFACAFDNNDGWNYDTGGANGWSAANGWIYANAAPGTAPAIGGDSGYKSGIYATYTAGGGGSSPSTGFMTCNSKYW